MGLTYQFEGKDFHVISCEDLPDHRVKIVYNYDGDDGENILAARDHCGIKPLYIGYGKGGSIWFASELKAICDQCETIEEFPAGYYWTPVSGFVKYYRPEWDSDDYVGRKVRSTSISLTGIHQPQHASTLLSFRH